MNTSTFFFIASIPIFFISCLPPSTQGQQPYIRRAASSCTATDTSISALGYTCNGLTRSCQAYLTLRAQPPYNSLSAISDLLSTTPSRLARLNSLHEDATLETHRVLLVPVPCSCSGQYYQANTSFVINHLDTYFLVANNTFQGLSTCQALKAQNSNVTGSLYTGTRITVPLRCACPTKNQTYDGVKYLLTYLITWKQSVSSISQLFKVDTSATLAANGLSEQDHTIYPFTTLLIPLENPPSSSQVSSDQLNPPPSPPPTSGGSGKPWKYTVVGVVGGLVLAAIVCYLFFAEQKQKTEPQSTKVYTIEELKSATQDFSPDCLIKGSVYRGRINGDFAAIKKMSGDVSNEIKILDKLNHFNLIRLSGACFNQGFCYFVYEYAANGSLRDWIHHSGGEKILSWRERLQIAVDAATGINYLHNYTSPPLVHQNINASNVLLDQDLRGKLTNFGLARSAEGQEGQFALTKHIVGTQGYIAPEYMEKGLVSPMLDVFAFGVLMLEIFTGKEASLLYEVDVQVSDILVPVLQEEDRQEKLDNFMDPLLQGNYPPQLAVLVLELIDKCLKNDPSDRPTADDVGYSGGSPSHLNSSLTEWLDCTASSSPWFVSSQPHEVAAPCRSSSSLMLLHSSCSVAVVTGDAAAARRRRSSDSWSFVHAATPLSLAQVIQQQQLRLVFTRNTPPRTTNGRPRLATAPATPSATWGNDSGQVQFH